MTGCDVTHYLEKQVLEVEHYGLLVKILCSQVQLKCKISEKRNLS